MPRPKTNSVIINLKFSYLVKDGANSLDSILVERLRELQGNLGTFAVEDLLKGLVRDAFKAGWPENKVQTFAAKIPLTVTEVDEVNEQVTEGSAEELDLDIPAFLQVSLS